MLEHAKERARRAGRGNVSFKEGDAEDPGTHPGWSPEAFNVILAGNVIQFLPRPAHAVWHWLDLLTPDSTAGIAWTVAQDPQWAPVIGAVDAYVPDGVPAFAAFMRRPPFGAIGAVEQMLTGAGYRDVATITRQATVTYRSPQQWWATYQTQGPWAISWRHIPPDRLPGAQRDACTLLERIREPDGSLTRTLTFAFTTGRKEAR